MGSGGTDPCRHRVGAGSRCNTSGSDVNRDEPEAGQADRHGAASTAAALVPKRPPGRSSRKASAYSAEIGRLLGLGYTLDAIREALADAGVIVGKSTVQREAARLARGATEPGPPPPLATAPQPVQSGDKARTEAPVAPLERQSGREIAEAFVRTRITNPLLRKDPQ